MWTEAVKKCIFNYMEGISKLGINVMNSDLQIINSKRHIRGTTKMSVFSLNKPTSPANIPPGTR